MAMRPCLLLVALSAALCCAFENLNLDRDAIRKSILQYRTKRSIDHHAFSPRLRRVRRQAGLPVDDEDGEGSGVDIFDGVESEPPTEPDIIESPVSPVLLAEWVWYRTKINFLDSIVYTDELADFHTETFHSLSEKIMFGVEDFLQDALPGYQEATPLMFTQLPTGQVNVLVDVGSCSSNSRDSLEQALRSLLRTGQIADLAVSEDGFEMREVGRDRTRVECLPAAQQESATTTTTAATTVSSTTTLFVEQTPPDDVDVVVRPRQCNPETEATCRDGQCIDRRAVCDGNRDCADGSDEPPGCGDSSACDPTEFLCPATGICVQKMWKCDGDDDCGDGYDELGCPTAAPGSNCRGIEFECVAESLCVPASYQCDGETDCSDASDESGCARPTVIRPPRKNITVIEGDAVIIECEAIGVPTPLISWRLNWGNVGLPPRVSMTSSAGRGELIIKEARFSDQGAYTCEAINSQGSIFAIPDAILTVEDSGIRPEQPVCPPGQYGMEEDNCRPCYCFGVTNECVPLEMEYDEIGIDFKTDDDVGYIDLQPAESEGADPTPASEPINRNQILVKPAARELQLIDLSKRFLAAAHYWSLPAQFLGAKINSYGGTLTFSFSYNNSYNFDPKPTNYSDVIIEGANGKTLVYHGKGKHPEPEIKHTKKVGLGEDGWTTSDGEPATREDMLGVLNNIDKLLLRTVYDNSMLSTGIGDIRMSVAQEGENKTGMMAYEVEKCICPDGYEGLSCQNCAPGYERITAGPFLGRCELVKDEEEPCPDGYAGADCSLCDVGYEEYEGDCVQVGALNLCNEDGSDGMDVNGRCKCKANVQGDTCDQCNPGYFHLSARNVYGCVACFCMGVTDKCDSSEWRRSKIVPRITDGDKLHLTNAGATRRLRDIVSVRESFGRRTVLADLRRQPRDVFYWVMPSVFTGDRIASYGGELRYTVEYKGTRPIISPDVKMTGNGITLQHTIHDEPSPSGRSSSYVKMTEENWEHPDLTPATREEFLMALADLDSLLIRATYATDMDETSIYDISLETAGDASSGRRAVEVEVCDCPSGYQGSSCEDCAPGYYRSGDGSYLGSCIRCSCNGHSDTCDPNTGECIECRHGTTGPRCDRCADGFYGDPRLGTPSDCRPCPCPILPSRSDVERVASCYLDLDGLPTCNECPPGYEGRNCDVCSEGYEASQLKECRKVGTACQCDPNGSVDGTCNEQGKCNCKASVEGSRCDSCKPSYFYFSVENTGGGCMPCFCMGVTTQCESSTYVRDTVQADFARDFGGFSLINRGQTQRVTTGFQKRSRNTILTRPRMSSLADDIYYWELPREYLGDKVVSYGGDLKYAVSFTPLSSGIPISQPDVILIGNDITLVTTMKDNVSPREATQRTVTFRETYWERADGMPATREHLLMALADLESLLIRASYSTSMSETTISAVTMETASAEILDGVEFAYEVEQCTCPSGYEGLSCEDCAPGYTRSSGGFYLGLCSPCQCNGRADSCDSETGTCSECRDNTAGDHCESCAPGFYSMSSDPADLYCSPCACPIPENSFSKTCEYVPDERSLRCTACEAGYEGTRCEFCAEGYEGNPRVPGGKCVARRARETPPRVTVTPSSLRVKDGSEAALRCEVTSSYVDYTVTWRKVGSTIFPPSVVLGSDGASITIQRFSRLDAGTYECEARDGGGVGRANGVLSWAPRDEKISVRVEEPTYRRLPAGGEVTFVCTAQSENMGYIVYWAKRNGRLPRARSTEFNGILHIKNLKEEDSGTYVCTGSNMFDVDQKTAELVVVRGTDAVMPTITIEPDRQVVQEGKEARFRCSADGTPPIRIEWRPSAGESLPENARIVDGELYLPAVSTSDSAVFYCRAHNSEGYVESTAVLDVTAVGAPPVVTVTSSTAFHTEEGRNVEMRCTATGLPLPVFSWRRVGRARLPDTAQPRGGTLLIMNVKLSDGDTYVCTARNDFGEDSAAILVNVTSKATVEKPICKTDPEFLTAYVGADTSVTCVPQGDPLPTVTWVRADGRPLPSNSRIDGNRLVLNNVRLENAGNYICIATNPGGTTRSQMTLKVENKSLPEVEILPRNQLVVEVGKSANFTCKPTAGLPVEVTWSRTDRKPFTKGTILENEGVIKFPNVTEEDGGSYLCIARNVVGFREVASLLSVIKRPTITVEPATDVYLRKGSSISLRCNADGIPIPNVAWERIHMFGRGVPLTHYKRHSNVITIRADEMRKASQYVCVARSVAGDARQKVTVTVGDRETVIPPEVTIERRIVSTPLGRRIQLRCAASGFPAPDIEWSKRGGDLPAGSEQEHGVLTIESAGEDSAGAYICEASNTGGNDSAESTLRIIIPPKLKIDPSGPVIRLPAGDSAVITCSALEGTDPVIYEFNKVTGALSDNVITSGDRLQIISFDPATDSGAYTCVGRNQAGSNTGEVTLLELEPPTIEISEDNVTTASTGDSIELRCTSSDVDAEIRWRKIGAELDRERVSTTGGILHVSNVQLSDAGEYECQASNKAGSSRRTALMHVMESPEITITLSPDKEIRVGGHFEISCSSSGTPLPTVTIAKDGLEILSADNGSLVVDSAKKSDSGTYQCMAISEAGTAAKEIEIAIEDPLMLSIIPDIDVIEARSGEDVAISCVVKDTDFPITWRRERGDLPVSATVSEGLLQISKVNYEDGGKYICAADVEGLSLTKEIQVIVEAYIPYFTQTPTSYLSLIGIEDFYRDLSITISFRANAADGLLLYSSGSGGDFFSLALVKGKVEFRYNVGSGDAAIVSEDVVQLSKWHTVTIVREGREGQLVVDREDPVYGTSEGSFEALDLDQTLYVGGYPISGDGLPEALQFLGLDVGFYGCISQLIIGSRNIDLRASDLIVSSVGILRCKTCGSEEEDSPCQHGSSCTESYSRYKGYVCGCIGEYVGPECQFRKEDICGDLGVCGQSGSCIPDYERELGYRCECVPGHSGPRCEYNQNEPLLEGTTLFISERPGSEGNLIWDEDEPSEEASSFSKGSYMQLDASHDDPNHFEVRMRVKLRSLADGLILYNGELLGRKKRAILTTDIFASAAMRNGRLEFRYNCGAGTAIVTSPTQALKIGQWHTIRVNRVNREGLLEVDGVVVAEGESPVGGHSADLDGALFLGGVKFWDRIPSQVGVTAGLDGCIDTVFVDGRHASLRTAVTSKNVDRCETAQSTTQRTEAETTTTTTSSPDDIDDISPLFINSGLPAGFSGSAAKFSGDSFASFPQETFPHDSVAEQLSLHFKARDTDGLILLHGRSGSDFILVGLRNANLEYMFQLGTIQHKLVSRFPLADGRWHNITVVRRGSLALMWIDELPLPIAIHAEGDLSRHLELGDLFIGGSLDVPMSTGDRYRRGFRGCIKNVKITALDGTDVQNFGTTYFDDSATPSLQFGSKQGRKAMKGIGRCRPDKKRGRRFN